MTARYLALGDSYTIGEGVEPSERWPVQLVALLRANGIDIEQPEIIAATGWTTTNLAQVIDTQAPAGPYDLVSLLIGVNDQYQGGSAEGFARDFCGLLERAISLTGDEPFRVVVLSIPDWGVTPHAEGRDAAAIAAGIDAFNRAALMTVMQTGPHWVDVTTASREAGGEASMLAGDGLHPSGEAYSIWATSALRPALAALRKV